VSSANKLQSTYIESKHRGAELWSLPPLSLRLPSNGLESAERQKDSPSGCGRPLPGIQLLTSGRAEVTEVELIVPAASAYQMLRAKLVRFGFRRSTPVSDRLRKPLMVAALTEIDPMSAR